MSGRCRACDSILEEWEMKAIDPLTGKYTELCDCCITTAEESEINWIGVDLNTLSIEDVV